MSADLQSPPAAAVPHYRAISLWAVLSIVSAIATLTMFFTVWLFPIPLAAIYFGYEALGQIKRLPEQYTGREAAIVGMLAGALFGTFFLVASFWRSAVPHGYQVLDYSILEPDPNSKSRVPNAALELSNNTTNKVYVRGYMLPPPRGQWTGLTKFSICRNSDMCKFAMMNGSQPQDQIHIVLTGDRTMKYTSGEIGIGGRFSVKSDESPQPYYQIEAGLSLIVVKNRLCHSLWPLRRRRI